MIFIILYRDQVGQVNYLLTFSMLLENKSELMYNDIACDFRFLQNHAAAFILYKNLSHAKKGMCLLEYFN